MIRVAAAVLGLACLFCIGSVRAQEPRELFRDANLAAAVALPGEALRQRLVTVDAGVLPASLDGPPPGNLVLNLFDDVRLTATVSEVTRTPTGYVWSGRIAGSERSSATFAVAGGIVAGSIVTPGADFTIRSVGAGVYAIRQVNRTALPPEREPVIPGAIAPGDEQAGPLADDGSTIDLLVVYTPSARIAQGGVSPMEALIDLGISETNQAYAASGVIQRLRLVHRVEVSYTEAGGDIGVDLDRLQTVGDGHLDGVHALRDQYGADLVHLIVNSNSNACGIGYLMTSVSTAFASLAFGVTEDDCISPNYSFAHELGHNMGLHHDMYVTGTATGAFPYSRGYVNQAAFAPGAPASTRWRDVMAYNNQCGDAGFNCPRLLAFSSPERTHLGDPMGTTDTADAVRTLNETRVTVSNFRTSATTTSSFSVSDASIVEGNAGTTNARFTISLTPAAGLTTRVTYTTAAGTATTAGGSNTGSIVIPTSGIASPYPSEITVPAGYGSVTRVRVTLRGLTHSWPDDLDMLLVGPSGQTCLLMSDAGDGPIAVNNVALVFDDDGAAIPLGAIPSGTYRPTNYDLTADAFAAPAPAGPYGSTLAGFVGTPAAGTWRLFVLDDAGPDSGVLAGGWTLSLSTSSGADYVETSASVTLEPGATAATVDVPVTGDLQFELPETFVLALTGPEGATIGDGTGVGTIKNDDFSDHPLTPGVVVRTVHVEELRALIDAVRVARGLGAFGFAETLSPRVSLIRASHVAELRAALPGACAPGSYTDPVLTSGTTAMKAAHITEIRTAALACQ